MKKLILLIIPIIFFMNIVDAKAKDVTVYLFYGEGCPHCALEKEYLTELEKEYDYLKVVKYEVWGSIKNELIMNDVATSLGTKVNGVPFTVIGTKHFTGFNVSMKDSFRKQIEDVYEFGSTDVVARVIKEKDKVDVEIEEEIDEESQVTLPLLGKVNAKNFSLPLIAAAIGTVDGFNPCAMWILIFLISFLASTKDRKKMWILGSVFLLTSAFIYMLFMLSWLTISLEITKVFWIRSAIAVIAIMGAIFNLRSYAKSKKSDIGCEVVDDKKRKNIMVKIKKFVTEKNMIIAIIGIMVLAISVNFIELACSAGWPLLFTSVLAMNDLPTIEYFSYILIYILFFLLDDLIIFGISMFTFKVTGLSNKYSKYSHLIGGIIMAIIGILLLVKPEWVMFNF